MKKILVLTIFLAALIQIKCQTPYDPNVTYNFTWLSNITYNMDKLQLCQIPSPDKTHCDKCVNPLLSVVDYGGGVYSFCQLDWPVDNCYAYDFCVNCILCHDGYWLNQTVNDINYCIPKTRGCLKYDSLKKKCITCMDGWVMNTTVNKLSLLTEYYCMFVPDKNCLQYNSNQTCLKCASNYALVGGKCVLMLQNCETMSGSVCSKCKTNFQLDSTGKCVAIPPIPNCQTQVDFTCQSCVAGYRLENNNCLFVIQNCVNVVGTACQLCASGYYITADSKCAIIPKVENCLTQVDFTCTKCNLGFYLTLDGKCEPIPNVPNCQVQQEFVCLQCAYGFYVTPEGQCAVIPQIPNCEIQQEFTCSQCAAEYTLLENACVVVIPQCAEYAGTSCAKCIDGYEVTSTGKCSEIPKIPNCLLQISHTCSQCVTGYNLINNQCVYHIENCQIVQGTACTQCVEGYTVSSDGKCIAFDPFANYDPNCRLHDNTVFNKCLECSGGFFINAQGKCEQVDPLCKTYNGQNGYCLSCYVGFTLDSINGKCSQSVIIPETNLDLQNCNQYDFTNNVCVKCAEGSFFNSAGKCQKTSDPYCKVPSTDFKSCAQCYIGYIYDAVQGKCAMGNLNCATWRNAKCETCPKGYYLDTNSYCVLVDPNCKVFNPVAKKCLLCYPGFSVDIDNKCKLVSQLSARVQKYSLHCASFNDKGQCTECYNGYYVAQDTVGFYCEKVSDLCKGYNKTTGKCISCYLGYYLTSTGTCERYY